MFNALNLIFLDECYQLTMIFNGFSNLFKELKLCQRIIKKELINFKEKNDKNYNAKNNNNNIKQLNTESSIYNSNSDENNSTQSHSITKQNVINKNIFLKKKQNQNIHTKKKNKNKSKHVLKIALNEEVKKLNENIINKNRLKNRKKIIDKRTKNKIIFPLKERENKNILSKSAKLFQNNQKDIFTFDNVICKKYIESNCNDIIEIFSNNSINQLGHNYILLGKVEDNKMIKNKKKKLEESDKNITNRKNITNINNTISVDNTTNSNNTSSIEVIIENENINYKN